MIRANDSVFTKVSKGLRKILGMDTADQIEYGYRNSDLTLTEKGKEAVFSYLADQKEVDAHLNDLVVEDKAEEAAAKKESK